VSQSSEFCAITLCFASQRVFIFVYFVINLVRKRLDTPSYFITHLINLLSSDMTRTHEPTLRSKSIYTFTVDT